MHGKINKSLQIQRNHCLSAYIPNFTVFNILKVYLFNTLVIINIALSNVTVKRVVFGEIYNFIWAEAQ